MMCEIFDGHLLVLSVRTIEPVALSRRPGLPGYRVQKVPVHKYLLAREGDTVMSPWPCTVHNVYPVPVPGTVHKSG